MLFLWSAELLKKQNKAAAESQFLSSGHLNDCMVARCLQYLPGVKDYLPVVLYDTHPVNGTQK